MTNKISQEVLDQLAGIIAELVETKVEAAVNARLGPSGKPIVNGNPGSRLSQFKPPKSDDTGTQAQTTGFKLPKGD